MDFLIFLFSSYCVCWEIIALLAHHAFGKACPKQYDHNGLISAETFPIKDQVTSGLPARYNISNEFKLT